MHPESTTPHFSLTVILNQSRPSCRLSILLLLGMLSLGEMAAETSLSYVKPSLFKGASQEGFRIVDNGKDVTSSVQNVMIGEAQNISTGDALAFMNQAKPMMDAIDKGDYGAALEQLGVKVSNTAIDTCQVLLQVPNVVEKLSGKQSPTKLEGKLGDLAGNISGNAAEVISKQLDKLSAIGLKQTVDAVLSDNNYTIDAQGNLKVASHAPPGYAIENGWPVGIGSTSASRQFSSGNPAPDGMWAMAAKMLALKSTYDALKASLPGMVAEANARDRQFAADQKSQDEADARKLLADLQANPNLGLNQTAANNAQNRVRTAEEKRERIAALRGGFVRMHAHPWTVISPPGFGNHPDDVLDDANATTPVSPPAYHANVVQTGASTYMQWGTWEDGPATPFPPALVTTPGTGPAYWIAGRITPAHGVPSTGTASYNGTLEGTMHTHDLTTDARYNPVPVTGNFNLNADFAARSLNGSFSFTSGFMPGNSLTASGSWASGSTQHFGTLTGAGVYDGSFNGFFFGAGAEGIGGVWNAKTQTGAPAGTEFKAYGTYNGTRP